MARREPQAGPVVHYELHGLTPTHRRVITALRRQTNALLADIVTGGVCRWFPSRRHRDPAKLGAVYAAIVERLVR